MEVTEGALGKFTAAQTMARLVIIDELLPRLTSSSILEDDGSGYFTMVDYFNESSSVYGEKIPNFSQLKSQ